MKIPKLLVGRPGYSDYKLAVLAAPFELGGMKLQADAARYQADKQVEANRQQIQAQKEENDKAFQRNSSLGQKAQLMAAGLSEQQAMQVIAGNGATGEYQPAEIRSEMEGVDLTREAAAYGQGLSGVGQAVATTASEVASSFLAPGGGSLGAFVAAPFLDKFSSVLNFIDKSKVHTFVDLENWAKTLDPESEQGKAINDLLSGKLYNRVKHFAPGIKAFNQFVNEVYTANLDSNQAFLKRLVDMELEDAQTALADEQTVLTRQEAEYYDALTKSEGENRELLIQKKKTEVENTNYIAKLALGAEYDYYVKKMNYDIDKANYDLISDYRKKSLLKGASEAYKDYMLYQDPNYINLYIKSCMETLEGQYFAALLNSCRDSSTYTMLKNDPHFNYVTTQYDILKRCGQLDSYLAKFFGSMGSNAGEMSFGKKLPVDVPEH